MDIFELTETSKPKFENICNLRQPLLLTLDRVINVPALIQQFQPEALARKFPSTFMVAVHTDTTPKLHRMKLTELTTTTDPHIISDKHQVWGAEDSAQHPDLFSHVDAFLRPPLLASTHARLVVGTRDATTPLQYEVAYRTFFFTTTHSVNVQLFPPKVSDQLRPSPDYETLDFLSEVNPWVTPDTTPPHIEITLNPGQFLFVPAYWWHTFQCTDTTSILTFQYRTYMNIVSIFPQLGLHVLQTQNVRFRQRDRALPPPVVEDVEANEA